MKKVSLQEPPSWQSSSAHVRSVDGGVHAKLRSAALLLNFPPRALSRMQAAAYLGISPSKFDEMRKDGRVGPAKLIDGRKVWDIRGLDVAFDALPDETHDVDEDWVVAA